VGWNWLSRGKPLSLIAARKKHAAGLKVLNLRATGGSVKANDRFWPPPPGRDPLLTPKHFDNKGFFT
jgi:hypothetical protein